MDTENGSYAHARRLYESGREHDWTERCIYCASTDDLRVTVGVTMGEAERLAVCGACRGVPKLTVAPEPEPDATAAVLWDLGAIDPKNPFAAAKQAA